MQMLGTILLVLAAAFLWASKVRFWRARRRLRRGGHVMPSADFARCLRWYRDDRMERRGHDVLFLVLCVLCYAGAGVVEVWLIHTNQQLITGFVRGFVPGGWYAPIIVAYHAQAFLLGGWRTLCYVLSGCLLGHLFG